jgi:hypothetical protein
MHLFSPTAHGFKSCDCVCWTNPLGMQHEISFISSDIASSLTANKALTSLFSLSCCLLLFGCSSSSSKTTRHQHRTTDLHTNREKRRKIIHRRRRLYEEDKRQKVAHFPQRAREKRARVCNCCPLPHREVDICIHELCCSRAERAPFIYQYWHVLYPLPLS